LSRENSNADPRILVERLNRMIQNMDVEGIRALAKGHPLETIEASNYVNSKFRFAVQEIVSTTIQESKNR
jgi:hypothetical protein